MKEIKGNIWDFHKKGHWIVITTNGTVKANGEAVMGRGIALQAKRRYPDIPKLLGENIRKYGNRPYQLFPYRVITLPVKFHWRTKADLNLIREGLIQISDILFHFGHKKVYMVRPGCGNGQLDWEDVKPVLERFLGDRFVIVHI